MKRLALVVLLGLAGCASVSPATVNSRMQSWYGVSADALMDKWGVPAQTNKVDGQDWLIYRQSQQSSSPSVGIGIGGGGGHVFGSVGTVFGGSKTTGCVRQVVVMAGKVVQIRWQGDPQLCLKLTPPRP